MSRGIHFERVPLREFAKSVKREVNINPTETYRTLGCRLYGEGVYQREIKMGVEIKANRMFLVKENDFVINRIWAQKGSAGIVPPEISGSIVTADFPVFELDTTKIVPSYIAWYVKTEDFWEKCRRHSRGTSGRQRLSPKELPNITFPLCGLPEQKRIVAGIEGLILRIEEARRLRVEAQKDVEGLLRNNLRKIFSDEESETAVLGKVCKTTSGGTPSRNRPDYFEGNIPWLKSGELNDSLITDSEEHITEEALQYSSAKIFPKGTLLIALYGATVGKTGILGLDSSTNQAICALFPQSNVLDRDYLHWFLRHKRNDFLKKSFGGAQPNISQKLLRKTEIPLPPIPVQRRIITYLDSLQEKFDELKRLYVETEREIEELIPSILDRAFRGEL